MTTTTLSNLPAIDRATIEPTPALRVAELTHCYAGQAQPALDHVSFDVQPGEIFAILGPNGSGKSTLFKILTTIMQPTADANRSVAPDAAATIFGHDVFEQPQAVRQRLGVVFQQPSLDLKLTADENLLHQGHLYGLAGRDLKQRIDDALSRFGLDDRRREPVERFSGGMRRRLELGKAMLHRPGLLLMDEPSTGLDPAARRDLWQQLDQLREQLGVTIVLTTHLMDEAERCDRLAIFNQGKLVTVDTPTRLKSAIGGDVITVEPTDGPAAAAGLADRIAARFGPWDAGGEPSVIDGHVRMEKADGPEVVAAIASAWPGEIRRLSVGQPTLEDVFLHLTGESL
ncbi:ATP-binding cassette domain-containing protein [Phycisphaerales bacterium AB-hyl4]|uniref:ATP-binding cassette domain-containing protein n=1 Tax=Natronomicrosphaera hydrolytica TaxID=3242702 RepID=A0ABV4U0M1_9BACT